MDLSSILIDECDNTPINHPHIERVSQIRIEAVALRPGNDAKAQALRNELHRLFATKATPASKVA